jgi:predicted nucleic acid-binding protein
VDDGRRYVISAQILSEYCSAMLKNRAPDALIQHNIESMIARCRVLPIDLATIRRAHDIKLRCRFSYWDSLVVAAALQGDCPILYSEDLQHGQVIDGSLRVLNPFAQPIGTVES